MTLPLIPNWAVGNYPAGANPWSGTPYQVAPGYTAFTPAQKVAAQEMNYLFASAFTAARQTQSVPVNLDKQVAPSSFTTVRSAVWDQYRGLWLLGGGTNPAMAFNYGGDSANWASGVLAPPGSTGQSVVGLGVSPAGSLYYASLSDGVGTFHDYYSSNRGATWTNITTYIDTTRSVEYVNFGSVAVQAFGGTGSNGFLQSYLNPETAPSVASTAVNSVVAPQWLLKQNGVVVVAIPRATGSSFYWTSANGTTWTFRSSLPVNAGDLPTALTWNATAGVFVLTVLLAAGAGTLIATSPDGITWTNGVTLSVANFPYIVSDLTSVNGLIIGVVQDDTAIAPASAVGGRVFYSLDTGATWYWAPGLLTGGTTGTQRPRMYSNGASVIVFNSVGVRLGNTYGVPSLNIT